MGERKRRKAAWDATSVRSLRRHLGLTQQRLSDELGVRQQTVSEWETGLYKPRGPSATLLTLISERSGFSYEVANGVNHGVTESREMLSGEPPCSP